MNNVLTGRQGYQTAVADWEEEMSNHSYWVDSSWHGSLRSCEASIGKAGCLTAIMARSGGTALTARLELMRAWDAEHGQAAELNREWKAFVNGLPDGANLWRFKEEDNYNVFIKNQNGDLLKFTTLSDDTSKRGAMKAWTAINE